MATEYLGQRQVSLDVVPSRVAYLVRAGNEADFRRAVEEASTRWAGSTEPIVPVSPTGRVASGFRQIVTKLDLDAAVNVGLTQEAAEKSGALLSLPVVAINMIDWTTSPSSTVHPLNVGDRFDGMQLTLPSSTSLCELTAAGNLADDARGEWVADAVSVHPGRTDDAVGRAQLDGSTVLGFGLRSFIENYAAGSLRGPVDLHFTKPHSLRDALWFWNRRALSTPPFAAPMILLPMGIDAWMGYREQLEALIRAQPATSPSVVITSLSVPEPDLETIGRTLGYQLESSTRLSSSVMGPPIGPTDPIKYWINADPRMWVLHDRQYGERSHGLAHLFARETTTLDFASPVTFRRTGMVRARIGGLTSDPIPRRVTVAQLFMRDANWRHGNLEVRTFAENRYRFDAQIPTPDDILNAAVSRPYTPSDKGRYAMALHPK